MLLNHTVFGDGPLVIILHGLFGSARNWTLHAKALSESHRICTADLRNHGLSPWSSAMSYEVMAEDIVELIYHLEETSACIVGHSMGGKVCNDDRTQAPSGN